LECVNISRADINILDYSFLRPGETASK